MERTKGFMMLKLVAFILVCVSIFNKKKPKYNLQYKSMCKDVKKLLTPSLAVIFLQFQLQVSKMVGSVGPFAYFFVTTRHMLQGDFHSYVMNQYYFMCQKQIDSNDAHE